MPLFLNFRSLLRRHCRQPSDTTMQYTSQLYNLPLYACSDSVVEVASGVMGSEDGGTARRDSPEPYQPFLYLDANVVEAICQTEIPDTTSAVMPISTQSDKPLSYLNSDSALEVVSSVTDSEDESSTTQDWSSLDITFWSSDSDSEELEVVPAVMESEAVRLLAARIPPELFDDILFYVNVDRVSQREEYMRKIGNVLTRNRGEPSSNDILMDLKRCSLVCLFWANRCRQHMFSERTLEIRSYEDAAIFRRYFVGGCPRLTLVHQLISEIEVYQGYESGRSFLHLLNLLLIQDKLNSLFIYGPVPDGFNPAKLDTPHWGITPCTIVVPSSFLQNTKIYLKVIHLPSFYHVAKYIKHFSRATAIEFLHVTWDGQMAPSLPHAPSTIFCQRRPRSLTINAWGCTASVHLALTAVMLNPNCPLHRLSDEERVWMIVFMTLRWGYKPDPIVRIAFDVSEQTTSMLLYPFHFVSEGVPPTDRSASALSVVGVHAYIDDPDDLPANFDALVNHARTRHTIRVLVLLFDSFDHLQNFVKPFIEVLVLAAETIELVLAYEEREERKAVGVDLATLEPNGRINTWADEQFEYYWGGYLSLQMLQRQLKKKRWMSVH